MSIISAAVGWWMGHINHALIQAQIVDPVNAAFDDLDLLGQGRLLNRTTTATLSSGDNLIGGYTTSPYIVGGAVTYGGGIITVVTPGLYKWTATAILPAAASSPRITLKLKYNGVDVNNGQQDTILDSALSQTVTAGTEILCAAGDTLQLNMLASAGAAGLTPTPAWFGLTGIR